MGKNERTCGWPSGSKMPFFDSISPFILAETICVTDGGAAANKPCIFPFKFNGVTHFQCTWDQAHLTKHKAWCSTLVDATGHHVGGQGKWGNCGKGCPVPPDDRNVTTVKPSVNKPKGKLKVIYIVLASYKILSNIKLHYRQFYELPGKYLQTLYIELLFW